MGTYHKKMIRALRGRKGAANGSSSPSGVKVGTYHKKMIRALRGRIGLIKPWFLRKSAGRRAVKMVGGFAC